jgi:hypothetical protein
MNVLGLYVWKEWRDQRVGVIGMVIVVPLLFVLAAAMWSRDTLEMVTRPGLAASAGALLALLAVGMDLIPGELRRGRTRFLERLPAGLSRAFFAKLVFFTAFTAFSAAYAGSIACALHVVSFGTIPHPFLESSSESYVLLAIAGALWVFAVSSWVTHGALALPATVLVVAVLFAPMWFVFGPHSLVAFRAWELRGFCAFSAGAAGISACASFVRGYRFGPVPAHAARIGAVTAVLCVLPAWSWSAWRWYSTSHIDPHASTFHISSARLTEDGRNLFVVAQNTDDVFDYRNDQTLHVDVETGRWSVIGGYSWPTVFASGVGGPPHPRVRTLLLNSQDGQTVVDGSGNVVDGDEKIALDPTLPTSRDLGLDRDRHVWPWAGLGFHVSAPHATPDWNLYDPFRKHLYDPAVLFGRHGWGLMTVWIRPGSWLIERRNLGHELFDPDTRTSTPATSLEKKTDHLGPLLADGRFVMADDEGLCLYSPENGVRERLHMRGDPSAIRWLDTDNEFDAPIESFRPRLLRIFCAHDRVIFGVLDLETLEVSVTASCDWGSLTTGIEDDGALLVLEGNARVVRLRFGSADRQVVFPR